MNLQELQEKLKAEKELAEINVIQSNVDDGFTEVEYGYAKGQAAAFASALNDITTLIEDLIEQKNEAKIKEDYHSKSGDWKNFLYWAARKTTLLKLIKNEKDKEN